MNWKHLFAKKDFEMLLAEMAGEHRLAARVGPGVAHVAGRGLHHRGGHLRADRRGGGRLRRAGDHSLLRRRRRRLRPGRVVLRRVRRHGPRGRQRLRLRLHHAGRNLRLDHRLGPDSRILDGHGRRGLVVVGLSQRVPAIGRQVRIEDPVANSQATPLRPVHATWKGSPGVRGSICLPC